MRRAAANCGKTVAGFRRPARTRGVGHEFLGAGMVPASYFSARGRTGPKPH
jgi:hypothetical protein